MNAASAVLHRACRLLSTDADRRLDKVMATRLSPLDRQGEAISNLTRLPLAARGQVLPRTRIKSSLLEEAAGVPWNMGGRPQALSGLVHQVGICVKASQFQPLWATRDPFPGAVAHSRRRARPAKRGNLLLEHFTTRRTLSGLFSEGKQPFLVLYKTRFLVTNCRNLWHR